MIDMDMPWWEFIVRAVAVYGALLVMMRISGRRTVGQFTPFDLLVVMLLSESVSNALSGGDNSLVGGLIAAATLIGLNIAISFASSRNRKIADLVDGTPVLLGRNGKIFHDVVKRCRVAEGEVEQALREADVNLSDAGCIFLEADGTITILKKQS